MNVKFSVRKAVEIIGALKNDFDSVPFAKFWVDST